MSTEPDFDWPQAVSLLGDDSANIPEDMAAIFEELVESAHTRLDELKMKNPATDDKGISSLAHQLRGSLLNFGFTGVSTILLEIERHHYTPADYPGQVEEAYAAFIASNKMLAERYPSLRFC